MRVTRNIPGVTVYTPVTQLRGLGETPVSPSPSDSVVTTAGNILTAAENFVRDNPRTILGLVAFLLFK